MQDGLKSKKSVPKISALINSSVNETKKTPSLTLNSLGRCFVYTNYKNGDDSLVLLMISVKN